MSELRPNYSQLVPHYFSQLLISASKGSLPAVIAKDPSLCAEQAPGTAVRGGAHRSCTRPRAHTPATHSRTPRRHSPARAHRRLPPGSHQRPGCSVAGAGRRERRRRPRPRTPPGPARVAGLGADALDQRARIKVRPKDARLRAWEGGVCRNVSPSSKALGFGVGLPPFVRFLGPHTGWQGREEGRPASPSLEAPSNEPPWGPLAPPPARTRGQNLI